jgi:N-acetylglucosaminyl-diphospho-decaprenol L-rhamnosyltransferase
MTVYVIMPVFNRKALTERMIDCLRAQVVSEPISMVIVDDGSTDGTARYLAEQHDVTVLQGDGNLWWGGCIDLAFRYVFKIAESDDWVLLVNDDTQIKPNFLQCLLDTACSHSSAAVGSVVRNEEPPHHLLSIGAKIDAWWLLVTDKLGIKVNQEDDVNFPDILEVDALSGRGVLFPVSALKAIGGMRSKWLPHYLADYELSLRLKHVGWNLLVDMNAAAYSKDEYGNANRASTFKEKLFSSSSPVYFPAVLKFWWEASNWLQRLTLPIRVMFFLIFPWFRRARR